MRAPIKKSQSGISRCGHANGEFCSLISPVEPAPKAAYIIAMAATASIAELNDRARPCQFTL